MYVYVYIYIYIYIYMYIHTSYTDLAASREVRPLRVHRQAHVRLARDRADVRQTDIRPLSTCTYIYIYI